MAQERSLACFFRGDLYLSADAEMNRLLLGPVNGAWIGWFVVFARNAVVLAYSPNSRFLTDFEQARSGALPWYQVLLQPGVQIGRNDSPGGLPLTRLIVSNLATGGLCSYLLALEQSSCRAHQAKTGETSI